jgi:hypothetical protein
MIMEVGQRAATLIRRQRRTRAMKVCIITRTDVNIETTVPSIMLFDRVNDAYKASAEQGCYMRTDCVLVQFNRVANAFFEPDGTAHINMWSDVELDDEARTYVINEARKQFDNVDAEYIQKHIVFFKELGESKCRQFVKYAQN